MGLATYRSKRDFARTPEPRGKRSSKRAHRLYVIQKHAASRLHYDFRLEHEGVLLSWAVPKGPSLDPSVKRLAMRVEDHPIEYGGFEGVIPQGEYGGGTVMLWDRGRWMPDGDPAEGLRRGTLKFRLDGEKLRGAFALVRMKGERDDEGQSWLLIKERDADSRARQAEVVDELPDSVATGRTLDEIASDPRSSVHRGGLESDVQRPAVRKASKTRAKPLERTTSAARGKRSKRSSKRASQRSVEAPRLELPAQARKASLPRSIEPERPILVSSAPAGDAWVHEIKHDGYRLLCRIADGAARWYTRGGLDWTERFRSLSPSLLALPARRAWLDGEVGVLVAGGKMSFRELQRALSEGDGDTLVYQAFDLLHLDGYDLRPAPLVERKRVLAELLARSPSPRVLYSDHLRGGGSRLHEQACELCLEGIVSKRADSPYRSGKQRDWLKTKCALRQEFVIGGYTRPGGSRAGFGSLLLGAHDGEGRLRYVGRVGAGFDRPMLERLAKALRELAVARPPFDPAPARAQAAGASWVAPEIVVEVRFAGWTGDRLLRHASFEGLRDDKRAEDVELDPPQTSVRSRRALPREKVARAKLSATRTKRRKRRSPTRKRIATSSSVRPEVAGVALTHPERVLFSEQGVTKLDLARFYASIADRILPHVVDRPLSVVRCPAGDRGECFYQKHASDAFPREVKRVDVSESKGSRPHLMIGSLAGLIGLVQMGVLELHPWGSRADDLERPDRITFDLDPAPDVAWPRVAAAARRLRARLASLELRSFCKTTGGKGLHVVVPIVPGPGWDDVKAFSRAIAASLAHEHPDEYLVVASKAERRGRIFIDWLRNGRGATAVAAYSTRARPRATVATPLDWSELGRTRSDAFDVESLAARLKRRADPWRGFFGQRQTLSASRLRVLLER